MTPSWLSFGFLWFALAVAFALAFLVCRRVHNFGFVDVVWAASFAPMAVALASLGEGWGHRRLLVAALVAAWSIRLAWYLGRRVAAHHPTEDGRYQQLRRDWAPHLDRTMFWFFQAQALLVAVLLLPLVFVLRHVQPTWHPLELAGAGVWFVALAGEALADAQLAQFRRDPANRGRVCAVGLWGWTRHPNYFFEWLVWVGFALFASASPGGWVAWYAPALMLYFLLRVTGIAYTEAQLLRTKGDAYRAYQQRTSAFFPRPPREPKA